MNATRESASDTIDRLIRAVKVRCPDLELYDSCPLLPGQHAARWIDGDRRARVARQEGDDFFEVYCDYDPKTDEFGQEEALGWQETIERLVEFACD